MNIHPHPATTYISEESIGQLYGIYAEACDSLQIAILEVEVGDSTDEALVRSLRSRCSTLFQMAVRLEDQAYDQGVFANSEVA